MGKNWAITIGINRYNNLQALNYAKRDAEAVRDFFRNELNFEQVYHFSDDSSPIATDYGPPIASQPTYGTLRRFLRVRFEQPFLQAGDNFWFFFAGHGIRHEERDYLMPLDADPGDVERTAIPISYVTERLRCCGADNVVLFLDACRSEGRRAGLGVGTEVQKGVITFFSCSPAESSYEIGQLQEGAFTHALLQGLRIQGEGNCATVERLYNYLRYQVRGLNLRYNKPPQTPYAIVEPATKYHLILLPRSATVRDADTLKLDAYKAETAGDMELARQLWIRVLAVSHTDMDAISAIERIARSSLPSPQPPVRPEPPPVEPNPSKRVTPTPSTQLPKEVELRSERGVDYAKLRDLLAAQKWQEADGETARVMLQAAGRKSKGWLRVQDEEFLRVKDTDNFPCEDLRTINQLWLHYSDGKFGFSVQKEIYESLGGTREYNEEVWEDFSERVGWRKEGKWLKYSDLIFDQIAPPAHLPYVGWVLPGGFPPFWVWSTSLVLKQVSPPLSLAWVVGVGGLWSVWGGKRAGLRGSGCWWSGWSSLFSRIQTCNL